MKSISVVIPNYNGKELLTKNIPYVLSSLKSSNIQDFEIIVADDASKDDSIDFLKTTYPEIIVVKNEKNKGFAGNTNTGIYASKKDLVFILNSDVQLEDNYFNPLLKYFDLPDTFGVMGRIISMDGSKIQDGAKYSKYSYTNIIGTKNYLSKERDSLYSLFMSGANSLIVRDKLILLGGFNELFNPYYSEDVDLGLTAWRAGYKIYYDHTAICRHPNSVTIKQQPSDKVQVISKRNKFILHYLHLDGIELYVYLVGATFKTFFRLLSFNLLYAKSFFLFLKSIKKIKIVKNNYIKFRKKSIAEIDRFIQNDLKNDSIEIF